MKMSYLLMLLPILCTAGFFFDEEDFHVELSPNDPTVCTTRNISLVCTCTDLSMFNASDIEFKIGAMNEIESSEKVINESAASITVWDSKPNEYANICCKQKGETGDGACQLLRTYDYPVPVANLTCIVYDWSENMNCSWSHGTAYTISPKPTFEWRLPYSSCVWDTCPDMNTVNNYCFWNSSLGPYFSLKVMDFRVNLTAKCGEQTTNYYTINTKPHVKPAPMTSFEVQAINSTCARVTWTSTRREFTKIYEVWHTSKWNNSRPSQVQLFDSNTTGKIRENEAIFCGLIPATAYTFFGRVKPGYEYWSYPESIHTACGKCLCSDTKDKDCQCLTNSGYWSDETKDDLTTYGDIPSASPDVSPGGYWWDPKECETHGHRSVSFYWKHLDKRHENGEIRGYVVKLISGDSNVKGNDVAGYSNYYNENLMCEMDYRVTIQPRNINGTSKEASTLQILDSRKGVYPPTFTVEMSNTTDLNNSRTVTVEWHSSRSNVTGSTVFWCKKEDGQCALKSMFNWKSVGPDVRSTDLQIELPEDYLYGVSMETDLGSSGMTWQSCIYTKDVEPKRSPSDVKVHEGNENRALLVIFKHPACLSGEPIISYYIVEYCVEGKCYTEETEDNTVTLNDLEADKPYRIRVKGVTPTGLSSPWSEMVEKTPTDNSLTPGQIALIAFSSLFLLTFIIAGGICIGRKCCGWCKRTANKKNVLMIPITSDKIIPEENEDSQSINEGKVTPSYEKQISEDSQESGFGDGSPDSIRTSSFFNDSSEEERKKEQLLQRQQGQITNDDYVLGTEVSQETYPQPEDSQEIYLQPEDSQDTYPQPPVIVFTAMQQNVPSLQFVQTNPSLIDHANIGEPDAFLEYIPITETSSRIVNQDIASSGYVKAIQSDSGNGTSGYVKATQSDSGNSKLSSSRSGEHSASTQQDYTQLYYEDKEEQTGPLIQSHSNTNDTENNIRDVSDIVADLIGTQGVTNDGFESDDTTIPELARESSTNDYVFADILDLDQSSPDEKYTKEPPSEGCSTVELSDSKGYSSEGHGHSNANIDGINQENQDVISGLNTSESVFSDDDLMTSPEVRQKCIESQQCETTETNRNCEASRDGYVSQEAANQLLSYQGENHSDRVRPEEIEQTTPSRTSNIQTHKPAFNLEASGDGYVSQEAANQGEDHSDRVSTEEIEQKTPRMTSNIQTYRAALNLEASGDGYVSQEAANQLLSHQGEDHSDNVSAEEIEQTTLKTTSNTQTHKPAFNFKASGDGFVSQKAANQLLNQQGEDHSDRVSAEEIEQTTSSITSNIQIHKPAFTGNLEASGEGYVSQEAANQLLSHQGEDHSDRVSAEENEQTTPSSTCNNQTQRPAFNGYLPHSAAEGEPFNQGRINQRMGSVQEVSENSTHSSQTIPAAFSQNNGYVPHHFIENEAKQ